MANTTEKGKTSFDTIRALSSTRPLPKDIAEWPYEGFLVARAFSLVEDSVLVANIVNHARDMSPAMQRAFYATTLRPRRRFSEWPKIDKDDTLDLIAKTYGMSKREAKHILPLCSKEDVQRMRTQLETCGPVIRQHS